MNRGPHFEFVNNILPFVMNLSCSSTNTKTHVLCAANRSLLVFYLVCTNLISIAHPLFSISRRQGWDPGACRRVPFFVFSFPGFVSSCSASAWLHSEEHDGVCWTEEAGRPPAAALAGDFMSIGAMWPYIITPGGNKRVLIHTIHT